MDPAPSGLLQIIYSSQPFGYDAAILAGILMDARRCNARDGVTGALICRRDIFLQLIEGPEPAVRAAFARISRDDRHTGIILHASEPAPARLFGAWSMLDDPADSWLPLEGKDSGFDRLDAAEARAIFTALAARSGAAPPA
jgi:hypothetical protein